MSSKIILCNLSDANKIIDDERFNWICEVLLNLGVTEDVIMCENRDQFRAAMNEVGIDVDLTSDGDVKVYKKRWVTGNCEASSGWLGGSDCLVAAWQKPKMIKVVEGGEVYYKVELQEWSAIKSKTGG